MSDFVLTCESAADRTREFFDSRNIPVAYFHYEIDDVVYTDDLYQSITPDKFFAQIAAGAMPKTSQVSVGVSTRSFGSRLLPRVKTCCI